MVWSWKGFRRAVFGWEKFDTLEEYILNCVTVDDGFAYAKQHFTWEEDSKPADEWQEPHKAFIALQTFNTPSDCDDFASVFWAFLIAKGIKARPIGVWRPAIYKEGHAVVVYPVQNGWQYIDNYKRPRWTFSSVQSICKDIFSDAESAKYVNWDNKTKRFVYAERIPLE